MPNFLRRWWPGLVSGAVSIAIHVVRFMPDFSMRKIIVYDDFAYFGGAQALAEGRLPYHTFPFVQPPGAIIIAIPAAFIGRLFGGDIGMASLRALIFVLAAFTCVLIADLLRTYGVAASLAGSLFYATNALSVVPSQTFYLEPFLALAFVLSFWLLRRPRTHLLHYFVIGGVLGIAITIKAWAIVDIFVIGGYLLARHGRREALWWLGGVTATATAICLPLFVIAPTAMWDQIVVSQLSRVGSYGLLDRLASVSTFSGFPGWTVELGSNELRVLGGVVITAALFPLLVQLYRDIRPSRWEISTWWILGFVPQVALLAFSPVFYLHYLCWPVAALSLGIGRSTGLMAAKLPRFGVSLALGVIVIALTTSTLRWPKISMFAPTQQVRSFTQAHRCTWFGPWEFASNMTSRDVSYWGPCRPWPDPLGVGIIYDPSHRFGSLDSSPIHLDRWQSDIRKQLRNADSAVTCRTEMPQTFSQATAHLFSTRFKKIGAAPSTYGTCYLWELRG